MKKIAFLSIVLLLTWFTVTVRAQDKTKAKNEKSITWYGIDFTAARFMLVTEDPNVIVKQYLKSINMLIQTEQEKYDLKKWFNKSEVNYDLDQVNEKNAAINPDGLVVTSGEERKISTDDVKRVISGYNTGGKSGLGLIFIAEYLDKPKQTGSYYVCFFDQNTKEIVDAQRYEAKAGGIGFRNYWAASVFNIMKMWSK